MNPDALIRAARTAASHGLHREALTLLDALGPLPAPGLWVLRASLQRELCDVAGARESFGRALALGAPPAVAGRRALLMAPIMGPVDELARERAACLAGLRALAAAPPVIRDPVAELPWLDFYLAYRGGEDRDLRSLLAQVLIGGHPALGAVHPAVARPRRGPVRVGVCSSHLRDHTIGRLNRALIEGLGAHGIEVVVLAPGAPRDALARQLHAAAHEAVVIGRALGPAREAIASARLDVLHFPDLGMDPFTWLLSLGRLAPVQTVSWGHPITSGSPHVDAFLASDGLVPPGTEGRFTERVIRLADPMVRWTPPPVPPPVDRRALGLPAEGRLYLCPQSLFKLHPDFDPVLRGIGAGDPAGTVVLLGARSPAWQERLRARICGPQPGLRLVFAPRQPREGYLALLRAADVIVDPFPFAGGHTSLEAFAMGTPVVTLPTDKLRGRITGVWLAAMGLGHRVATSPADMVAKALDWARPGPLRDTVRAELAAGTPRLFDHPGPVADHAAVFSALAQAARAAAG